MNHGANAPAPGTPPLPSHHSSPSVAHSFLRGTQEGWAALEDSSTAEALRKLDGLSGNSVGSGSRPTTPGQKTGRLSRPGSKEQLGLMTQEADPPPDAENKTPGRKPSSRDGPPDARASFGPPTPKRGSAGSTTFTGTPTTGSRDSASLSTAASATSTSLSSRKLRRNSGGSDASSGYAAAEAGGLVGEEGAAAEIPPVPPLPKGLPAYKTPPMSAGVTFPGSGPHMGMGGGDSGFESASEVAGSDDPDRTVVFPSMSMTITSPTSPPPPVPTRQPSKKWSFSNALNLRLPSGSPKDSLHVQKELPNTPQKDPHGYVASPQKTPHSQGSVSFSAFPVDTSSPAGSGARGVNVTDVPSPTKLDAPSLVALCFIAGVRVRLFAIRVFWDVWPAERVQKIERVEFGVKFPEPIPPKSGLTPPPNDYLCEYERKGMMDFPRVYCVGAGSKKNMATLNNSANNYGYDDERGDYLVIKHDHLAYRYEIIDTLGKGRKAAVAALAPRLWRRSSVVTTSYLSTTTVISKCLVWDPERRLKPQPALHHPFITAGRRPKIMSPAPTSTRHLFTPSSSTSAISSVRTKPSATPQKSQIGAPTPLSSRIATRAPTTTMALVPQTPTSSHTNNLGTASARRYHVPASSSAYSSRTLAPSNGYTP
ncbi:hypothetical protein FRC06_006979 [Ceratobasidium sp. 370]|nr:hypothetical protein FRC06_006979 [Ceratobasidium sp. 370]